MNLQPYLLRCDTCADLGEAATGFDPPWGAQSKPAFVANRNFLHELTPAWDTSLPG